MRQRSALVPALLILAATSAHIAATETPADLLLALEPDASRFIHDIRVMPAAAAGPGSESIYSGLVRIGGTNPLAAADAPASGKGAMNDIVLFADALGVGHSRAWTRMILDHEYFHARHLAGGWRTPMADFGESGANHAYYEATAWGFVIERALAGAYGELRPQEFREVRATYKRHYEGIRAFILGRQPTAWAHFGRFMPDVDGENVARVTLSRHAP